MARHDSQKLCNLRKEWLAEVYFAAVLKRIKRIAAVTVFAIGQQFCVWREPSHAAFAATIAVTNKKHPRTPSETPAHALLGTERGRWYTYRLVKSAVALINLKALS